MEIAPTYLNSEAIIKISKTLNSLKESSEPININLNNLQFSLPIGILAIGSMLKDFINYRKNRNLETNILSVTTNSQTISYLKHISFFQYIGLDIGNTLSNSFGNSRYIPIQRISKDEFIGKEEKLQILIHEKAHSLANVLLGTSSITERDALLVISYSIREILRNVFEHSGSDECFVCAQRWADGRAEIAILDNGLGIFNTLSEVYEIDEKDAISLAIKPGITRTSKLTEDENIHQNSGYGLYAISEIGRSFGEFYIGSGTKIYSSNKNPNIRDSFFRGTFVGLSIRNIPVNFNELLQDIIKAGEDEAQKEGRSSKASNASKLAEYFK